MTREPDDDGGSWTQPEGRARYIMRPLPRLAVPIALPIDAAGIHTAARSIRTGERQHQEQALRHGDPRIAAALRAMLAREGVQLTGGGRR